MGGFRPWGPFRWLLPKIPVQRWALLGVLGTEDRCTAVLAEMRSTATSRHFLEILDPHVSPDQDIAERLQEVRGRLLSHGVRQDEIRTVQLLDSIDTMREEVDHFLAQSGPNVILDITSMPKWWSFPIVRFLLQAGPVENLVITYTSAEKYGQLLSSDPKALGRLPTFDGYRVSDRYDEVIIGVGFAPLGLKDLYAEDIGTVRYIFPFPPGPPNFSRNWHFLRELEEDVENRKLPAEDRLHIHMYDVPSAFDAFSKLTKRGTVSCAVAPFGPKTLSLSMCLFALAAEEAQNEPVHAFYTQPQRYALDYTTGVNLVDGVADVKAYFVRAAGRNFYHL